MAEGIVAERLGPDRAAGDTVEASQIVVGVATAHGIVIHVYLAGGLVLAIPCRGPAAPGPELGPAGDGHFCAAGACMQDLPPVHGPGRARRTENGNIFVPVAIGSSGSHADFGATSCLPCSTASLLLRSCWLSHR